MTFWHSIGKMGAYDEFFSVIFKFQFNIKSKYMFWEGEEFDFNNISTLK